VYSNLTLLTELYPLICCTASDIPIRIVNNIRLLGVTLNTASALSALWPLLATEFAKERIAKLTTSALRTDLSTAKNTVPKTTREGYEADLSH